MSDRTIVGITVAIVLIGLAIGIPLALRDSDAGNAGTTAATPAASPAVAAEPAPPPAPAVQPRAVPPVDHAKQRRVIDVTADWLLAIDRTTVDLSIGLTRADYLKAVRDINYLRTVATRELSADERMLLRYHWLNAATASLVAAADSWNSTPGAEGDSTRQRKWAEVQVYLEMLKAVASEHDWINLKCVFCDGSGKTMCTHCVDGSCLRCSGTGRVRDSDCEFCVEGKCRRCLGTRRVEPKCSHCFGAGMFFGE